MSAPNFEQQQRAFRQYLHTNHGGLNSGAALLRGLVAALLEQSAGLENTTVLSRVKGEESSLRKFAQRYRARLEEAGTPYEIREHLTDLIGLRVICVYESEVEEIAELLRDHFEVVSVEHTDSLGEDGELYGYSGLQMALRLGEQRRQLPEFRVLADLTFEVQIRTLLQDAWCYVESHIKYKHAVPVTLRRSIHALAALFELADRELVNVRNQGRELEADTRSRDNWVRRMLAKDGVLTVFELIRAVHGRFPGFDFARPETDRFTLEILARAPGLTKEQFSGALDRELLAVRRFREEQGLDLDPYEELRHALYCADPQTFGALLPAADRERFERWQGTTFSSPSSVTS